MFTPPELDPHQLAHVLAKGGGLEAVRDRYPVLYSGLEPVQRLKLVRHLREEGFSAAVIAAVLDVSLGTAYRYIRRCGATEPKNLIGEDGKVRGNHKFTGKPRPFEPLLEAGRPVETGRPDLLIRELRAATGRVAKMMPLDIPHEALAEIDRLYQLAYTRDPRVPAPKLGA